MNMRALVLIGALGLATLACAQDSTSASSRWRIGLSGSYDLAYRTLVTESPDANTEWIVGWRNGIETPKKMFTFNIDLRYDLGRHWGLASGLQYADRGYQLEASNFISVDPITSDPAVPISVLTTYHYQYFSVPLLGHYRFGDGRVHFEPGAGIMADLRQQVYSIVVSEFSDGRSEETKSDDRADRYRSFTLTACVEFNVHFALAKRWELRAAPRARYQLIPASDTNIADRLWEAGLLFGCFYRL